jgi:hypothetical protein
MPPLVCSLLLAVVSLSAVVLADNGLELVQVQVMHRHGAREALVGYNNTIVCGNVGNPYRCGELNEPGKLMLLQLGDLLHTRYTALLNFTDSYSQYVAYTRSTDLNRTVQSAAALLKGFFPNSSAYFPIVNTVTFATDLLLLVDAQMSFHIPALLNEMPGYSLPESFFTMFTDSELRQMGRESFQEALCVLPSFNQTTIAACALTVQDVAAAWEATGRLPSAPTMLANFDKLNEMRRIHNTLLFVYDPSNPIMKSRGNLGYNLASTIASKMYQQAGLSPRGFLNTRFFHWSAHDTTYMPLASAIGMNNADFMRPLFGQAFIFELWRNRTSNEHFVRIYNGAPKQYPSNYSYNFTELNATGLDENGNAVYGQGAAPLPLEAFSRLINSTKGTDVGNAVCFLTEDMLKTIGCDGIAAPTNPKCILYRQQCPDSGCPGEYSVDPMDLSCVALVDKQVVTTSEASVMIVVSAVAGLLIGAAATQIVHVIIQKRRLKSINNDYSNHE